MPAVRKIVHIDEEKCTGCGLCIPDCEEGAIEIVDGKARLVADVYCDGLGNCLRACPEDAITIIEREADAFDEQAVNERLAELGAEHPGTEDDQPPSPKAFSCPGSAVRHLRQAGGCPGSAVRDLSEKIKSAQGGNGETGEARGPVESRLANWPVQLSLVPIEAPYFDGARLLISADCVPFALGDFHSRLLADRVLLVGCPKLDDGELYRRKLAQIFARNNLESIDIAHMEVPCCFGLLHLVTQALEEAGRPIPVTVTKIGLQGDVLEQHPLESVATGG